MTSITGQSLEWIQTLYHNLIGRALQSTSRENILLSQYGDFTQAKIDSTLKLAEAAILESGDKRQTMKRFTSLLIEVLQNISLHGARDKSGHMHAFLIISRNATHYKLLTGNLVLEEDMAALHTRLTELNNMDKNSLRKLYIETLCNDEFSYKGGAGLGLLTVAKRADEKLNYEIHPLDQNFGYFQMEARLAMD